MDTLIMGNRRLLISGSDNGSMVFSGVPLVVDHHTPMTSVITRMRLQRYPVDSRVGARCTVPLRCLMVIYQINHPFLGI